MLLAVDVGNTNVTFALFDGDRLAADWRVTAHRERTADEMAVELRELFSLRGLELDVVTGVVISSVVPILNAALIEASRRYLKHEPGADGRLLARRFTYLQPAGGGKWKPVALSRDANLSFYFCSAYAFRLPDGREAADPDVVHDGCS